MSDIIDLLGAPLSLIVAVFALLGFGFLIKESARFLQDHVLPSLYAWRNRRRLIALPYAQEVFAGGQRPVYFRDGGPTLVDIRSGYVYVRPDLRNADVGYAVSGNLAFTNPPSAGYQWNWTSPLVVPLPVGSSAQ